MLDFIDTNLFKEYKVISVIVYSNDIERGKKEIYSLIEDEDIILLKESKDYLDVTVLKNMRLINIRTVPLSSYARGYRTVYAIVDKNIFNMIDGVELFSYVIEAKNIIHHSVLSDENIKPNKTIMMF